MVKDREQKDGRKCKTETCRVEKKEKKLVMSTRRFCDVCDSPAFEIGDKLDYIRTPIPEKNAKYLKKTEVLVLNFSFLIKNSYAIEDGRGDRTPDICLVCILDLLQRTTKKLSESLPKEEGS